jgi:predicted alpha-1,6-mannanase (GH76 family)
MKIEKFNLWWEALIVGPIIEAEDRESKVGDRGSRVEDRMKVARKKSGVTSLPPPE